VSGGEAGRLGRVLTPDDVQAIGLLDLQQLARENAGGGFQADAPLYGVLNCLRMWENLILRMEEGWRRQDYYMVYEYLNILTVRSGREVRWWWTRCPAEFPPGW
jgi:hypothetical protein